MRRRLAARCRALTRPWAWAVRTAALGKLADRNGENQKAIAAAGGVEAVVGAMRAHSGAAEVQKYGCWGARAPPSPVQWALLPGLNGPEHMCIRGWEASDICVGIYMRPWCAVYGTQYCILSSQRAGTASYAPHTAAPCAGVTLRTLSIFLTCYHCVAASSTADPQHVLLATPPYTQSLLACSAAPFSQRHLFSYTRPLAPHCISNNRYLIIDIPEHLSKYARVWNALGYLSIQGWVRSALDSRLLSGYTVSLLLLFSPLFLLS